MSTALIIGFGSVGRRHASILKDLKKFKEIVIFTNQNINEYKTINSLKEIKETNPDYIIISSITKDHFKYLSFCEKNLKNKKILVEKPLFSRVKKLRIKNNLVYVGYNLRFHPVIRKIKQEIKSQKIFNLNIQNSSYLPSWRSNQNYSRSNSAQRAFGGGVLLEISHELDLLRYLFGDYKASYIFNQKISNLNINTDDILILIGKLGKSKKRVFNINLNFFSRIYRREILIDTEEKSIYGDLINANVRILTKNKNIRFSYANPRKILDKTYVDLHKSILGNKKNVVCDYKQGLKIMQDIREIQNNNN